MKKRVYLKMTGHSEWRENYMKKKSGFTLVELLAVIVILAVIALIAVPNVLSMIESARKGAAESSAMSYVDAIEKTVILKLMNASSDIDYNQNYSVTGLTLTKYKNTVGDIKPCLNKKTNAQEEGTKNGLCGDEQKVNPNFLTFNVDVKGDQPIDTSVNTIKIADHLVVELKMQFYKYKISYYYDRKTGDIRMCSTEGNEYISKENCESK